MVCAEEAYGRSIIIQGTIVNAGQEPIAFANVLLLDHADSSFVHGVVSDMEGHFSFEREDAVTYLLKAQFIGYEPWFSGPITGHADLGRITLIALPATLEEVEVAVTRPLIEQQLDRMVVNVENSPASAGSTALELLERSPGVAVDQQSATIRMLNRPGVLIQINGRQSHLAGSDLIEYLRSLSAEQIARIEIITNPSARHDAAGHAGIINIVLRRDLTVGTNGSVTVSGGRGLIPDSRDDLWRGSLTTTVDHRAKRYGFYTTVSLLRDGIYSDNSITRSFGFEGVRTVFDQKIRRGHDLLNSGLRAGGDVRLGRKTSFGIGLDLNATHLTSIGTNTTDAAMNTADHAADLSIVQAVEQRSPREHINANVNLRHDFNDKGHTLLLDVDRLNYDLRTDMDFDAVFRDAANEPTSGLRQMGSNISDLSVFAAKLDYERPLNERTRLELGAKSGFVTINSELIFNELVDGAWMRDTTRSNHFIYEENINALYGSVKRTYQKLSVQAGLRAEQTRSDGTSVTLGSTVKRDYLSLFPTFFSSYDLGDDRTLKLSYARRLDRPRYDQLNPFIIVLDPYSYATGNPYLQPQFTNTVDLGYHFKTHSIGLNYARTDHLITELTIPDDSTKITRTIETNLDRMQDITASLNLGYEVKKVWQANINMSFYRQWYHDGELLGGRFRAAQWMCYVNMSNTFILPGRWRAELSAWYMSPFIEGIIVGRNHRVSASAGIQRTVLKDRARIKLSASDMFLTSFVDGYVDYQNVHLTFRPRYTTRRVMLTFSYNFGDRTGGGPRKKGSAADGEKERIEG